MQKRGFSANGKGERKASQKNAGFRIRHAKSLPQQQEAIDTAIPVQALNFSSSSLPSLLATAMAATESPTQFREVTSISIGRLIARIRV